MRMSSRNETVKTTTKCKNLQIYSNQTEILHSPECELMVIQDKIIASTKDGDYVRMGRCSWHIVTYYLDLANYLNPLDVSSLDVFFIGDNGIRYSGKICTFSNHTLNGTGELVENITINN